MASRGTPGRAAGGARLAVVQCKACLTILGHCVGRSLAGEQVALDRVADGAVNVTLEAAICATCGLRLGDSGSAERLLATTLVVYEVDLAQDGLVPASGTGTGRGGRSGSRGFAGGNLNELEALVAERVEDAVAACASRDDLRASERRATAANKEELNKVKYALLAMNARMTKLMAGLVEDERDETSSSQAHKRKAAGPRDGSRRTKRVDSIASGNPGF